MTTLAFNELRRTNHCPKTAQNTIENLFNILNTYSNFLFELFSVLLSAKLHSSDIVITKNKLKINGPKIKA